MVTIEIFIAEFYVMNLYASSYIHLVEHIKIFYRKFNTAFFIFILAVKHYKYLFQNSVFLYSLILYQGRVLNLISYQLMHKLLQINLIILQSKMYCRHLKGLDIPKCFQVQLVKLCLLSTVDSTKQVFCLASLLTFYLIP